MLKKKVSKRTIDYQNSIVYPFLYEIGEQFILFQLCSE